MHDANEHETALRNMAWISLGGNVGDPQVRFRRVIDRLSDVSTGRVCASPVYRSAPWGGVKQPDFYNQVAGFCPRYTPIQTLHWLQEQERQEGRNRAQEERWGPRTIDLDVLTWPNHQSQSPNLILPQPRLCLRKFVLKPWADVAPNLIPFGLPLSVVELLEQCPDASSVIRCAPVSS